MNDSIVAQNNGITVRLDGGMVEAGVLGHRRQAGLLHRRRRRHRRFEYCIGVLVWAQGFGAEEQAVRVRRRRFVFVAVRRRVLSHCTAVLWCTAGESLCTHETISHVVVFEDNGRKIMFGGQYLF